MLPLHDAPSVERRVLIEPKFTIDRLFYLLGWGRRIDFLRSATTLGTESDLTEAFTRLLRPVCS